jgi:4'-phosphopantetheinyl transferase EntD
MSKALADLFPPGVAVAELREPGDVESLWPSEAACVSRAVPLRVQEFAAGRQCARRAMAEFGVRDFPLLMASDRRPLWPDTLAGSITHTRGFCAAAVAERARLGALGLDSEVADGVTEHLWPAICLPQELAWLDGLPGDERTAAATLLFSAKEALHKCQYPLFAQRLDFHDLQIAPIEWGRLRGAFTVRPARPIAIIEAARVPLVVQYLFHDEFVSTGVALPAAVP